MRLNWKGGMQAGLTGLSKVMYKKADNIWDEEAKEADFMRQQNLEAIRESNAMKRMTAGQTFEERMKEREFGIAKERNVTLDAQHAEELQMKKDAQASQSGYQRGMLGLETEKLNLTKGNMVSEFADATSGVTLTEAQAQKRRDAGEELIPAADGILVQARKALDQKKAIELYSISLQGDTAYQVYLDKGGDPSVSREKFNLEYVAEKRGLIGKTSLSEESKVKILKNTEDALIAAKEDGDMWDKERAMVAKQAKALGIKLGDAELESATEKNFRTRVYDGQVGVISDDTSVGSYAASVIAKQGGAKKADILAAPTPEEGYQVFLEIAGVTDSPKAIANYNAFLKTNGRESYVKPSSGLTDGSKKNVPFWTGTPVQGLLESRKELNASDKAYWDTQNRK